MANPNIVGVTTISGTTTVYALTGTPVTMANCTSGKVQKVNSLYVSNISSTSPGQVTVYITRSGTNYRLAANIVIGAGSTLDLISKSIYLNESDTLNVFANASSVLEAVCSYEEIS